MLIFKKGTLTFEISSLESTHPLTLTNRTHYHAQGNVLVYFSSLVIFNRGVRIGRIGKYGGNLTLFEGGHGICKFILLVEWTY